MSLNRRRLLPCPDCNPEPPQNALPDRRFLTMKKGKCSVCAGDGLSREPVGLAINAWNFHRSAMNPGANKPCDKCQGSGDCQTCHGSGDVYSY